MPNSARTMALATLAAMLSAAPPSSAEIQTTYPFVGVTCIARTEASPRPLKMHIVRIDLTSPAISFRVTPQSGPRDTINQTTRQFLIDQQAQLAINAHFFTPFPADVTGASWLTGLAASSATIGPNGHAFAPFDQNLDYPYQNNLPALNLAADRSANIVYQAAGDPTGYATSPPVDLYNTVSGNEQILSAGLNTCGVGTFDSTLNPRTAIGLAPNSTLILFIVDGRQSGISEGMTTSEVATLLNTDYGVTDAINLDGGGSSTLVMADPSPRVVNVPVGVNNVPGSERSVGSNLAVFSSPIMTLSAEGSRYLAVTLPPGLPSVALRIDSVALPCMPMYVDTSGHLTPTPVFQSASGWATVHLGDRAIIPATTYSVRADIRAPSDPENLSPPMSTTTWAWGDVNNSGGVDLFDIACVLDGFQSLHDNCSIYADDLRDNAPDRAIDIFDIVAVLDAFQGLPYPDTTPCAPGLLTAPPSADRP